MTEQRLLEITQAANLYGSSNCWTGTTGTLATMIRELIDEVERLKAEIERMNEDYSD